jgi:hypothetical protein
VVVSKVSSFGRDECAEGSQCTESCGDKFVGRRGSLYPLLQLEELKVTRKADWFLTTELSTRVSCAKQHQHSERSSC